MLRFLVFFVVFIFFDSCHSTESCRSHKIYMIISEQNMGEQSQIKGLVNALQKRLLQREKAQPKIAIHEVLFQDISALKNKLENETAAENESRIIVGSGESGLVAIEELKSIPHTTLIHTSHQPLSGHIKILDIAHFIVLPQYTVTDELRANFKKSKVSKLIETSGVIHNSSKQEVLKAYHNNINLVVSAPYYIVVMLGGDVSLNDDKVLYFSENCAKKLALYVKNIARKKNAHIIIVNGPRTGKYDPNTRKINGEVHRNGVIDAVTRKFISTLKRPPYKASYSLFDFQYGGKRGYANMAYGVLLDKKPGELLIPGDSDSYISEGADLFPGDVTVYYTDSMTPTNQVHVDLEFELKRINTLDENMKFSKARFFRHKKNLRSIAEQVADQIVESKFI